MILNKYSENWIQTHSIEVNCCFQLVALAQDKTLRFYSVLTGAASQSRQ
jgi:hypothetical protein